MNLTLNAIAELVGGRLAGRADRLVARVAPLRSAGPDDITFVAVAATLPKLAESLAGCAIVPEGCHVPGRDVVHHRNPYAALARVLEALHPSLPAVPGVSEWASVDASVTVPADASVGPFAVVARDVVLGERVVIGPGATIAEGCRIGAGTVIHPRAVLYPRVTLGRDCIVHSGAVLGADGFGFTRDGGRNRKIPQIGGVVLGADVEIGANSCIDSGTMEPTRIGTNTKIDNLVQVGHNCDIGERVILCGGVAIAGSASVEDDVTLAGQAGVAGHITIGAGSIVAAGSGVISNLPPGSRVAGMPHMPVDEWRRAAAELRHLHDLRIEVRRLRKQLDELARERRVESPAGDEEA